MPERNRTDGEMQSADPPNFPFPLTDLLDSSSDGLIVVDGDNVVRFVNDAGGALLGDQGSLVGRAVQSLLAAPHGEYLAELVTMARQYGRERSRRVLSPHVSNNAGAALAASVTRIDRALDRAREIDLRDHVDGRSHVVKRHREIADNPWVLIQLSDITRQQRVETELRRLSMHDALTGLPNRMLLLDRLDRAIARMRRNGLSGAVMYLDVDRFKAINDTMGHRVGDDVLRQVAGRIQRTVRAEDTVARMGGDEFVVLCEGVDSRHDMMELASRLGEAVEVPIDVEGEVISTRASIGVVVFDPCDSGSGEAFLGDADAAMYEAKRNRSAPVLFSPAMRPDGSRAAAIRTQLTTAVHDRLIGLAYQPIVNVSDRAVVGVEALARWSDPVLGEVPPAEFLPIAEELGLLEALGDSVFEAAAADYPALADHFGRSLWMSVNISSGQVSPHLVDGVRRVKQATEGGGLYLELAESSVVDSDIALGDLEQTVSEGAGLLVGNFGSGLFSLRTLSRLPAAGFKIGRGVVRDLGDGDESVFHAAVSVGEALSMQVVAEGVETESEAEAVERLGCRWAQGFYFGKPSNVEQLTA